MIDGGQAGICVGVSRPYLRIRCPKPGPARWSSPGSRSRLPPTPRTAGMSSSPGPTSCRKGYIQQALGPFEGRRGVVDLEADGANRRAVSDVEGMGKAFLLGVDDQIDVALVPARDRFGLVPSGAAKAEPLERGLRAWARWRRRQRIRRTRRQVRSDLFGSGGNCATSAGALVASWSRRKSSER